MAGSEIVEIVSWQLEIEPCRTNIKTVFGSHAWIQRGGGGTGGPDPPPSEKLQSYIAFLSLVPASLCVLKTESERQGTRL